METRRSKINGRKRHIVVDTLGLVLAVFVGAANEHDSKPAQTLLRKLSMIGWERLQTIIGDGAYEHLGDWLKENLLWDHLVFKRSDTGKTVFQVLPQRWKVERTISWLMWYRLLSLDYEVYSATSETFVLLANIHRILIFTGSWSICNTYFFKMQTIVTDTKYFKINLST